MNNKQLSVKQAEKWLEKLKNENSSLRRLNSNYSIKDWYIGLPTFRAEIDKRLSVASVKYFILNFIEQQKE